jgi:hypothetical protein
MQVVSHLDTSNSEGLRLRLYKSVIPGRERRPHWDFFLWGASNFLYIDTFNSLSQFARAEDDERNVNEPGVDQVIENRYLYIYKDPDVDLLPHNQINWIFQSDLERPLLVITLLKADLSPVISRVKDVASKVSLHYDFFKTLGQGTGVVVTRCKTYSQAISCLVELNGLNENTYSIAGVENPFAQQQPRATHSFLFSKLLQTDDIAIAEPQAVAINYMLKEGNTSGNRVHEVVNRIKQLRRKIVDDFHLSETDLKVWTYYEIGRFDIEVRIEGHIVHLLELLVNPDYGLATIESKFYKDNIFESRTTWKTPTL